MTTTRTIALRTAGAPTALGDVALRVPVLTRCMSTAHAALLLHARWCVSTRWFGSDVLVLETTGRRSGRPRVTPLVYLPHGRDVAVVPANAGADRSPAWWLNLQAAGRGSIVLGTERRAVVPSIAAGAERDRLWRRFRAVTPVDHYQRRCRRTLPVVVLTRAVDVDQMEEP